MRKKLFERPYVRTIFQIRTVEQTTGARSFYARVHLRRTHYQLKREVRIRSTTRPIRDKLEHHVNVLRLQRHGSILHSRFANNEWKVTTSAHFPNRMPVALAFGPARS